MLLILLLCLLHSFIVTSTNGLNITQILGQYPSFSTFNDHLSQTKVADQINGRNSITILAVDNAGMSPLSGKSQDVIKMVMSIHVVLDYYDVQKLQRMKNKTVILTTLYQTSGQARGQTGFLNATLLHTGSVAIGSAEGGSKLNSNLVKSVFSSPYNVSVLQVSSVIMPPGVVGPAPIGPGPGPTTPPAPAPVNPPRNPTGPPAKAPAPSGAMPMPPSGGKPPPMGGKAPAPGPSQNGGAMPPPAMTPNPGKAPAPMVASPPAPPGAGGGGAAGSNNTAGAPTPAMASPPAPPGAGAGAGGGMGTAPAGTTTSPAANDPAADAPQGGDAGTDNNSSATMDAVCSHVLMIFLSLLSILCFGFLT